MNVRISIVVAAAENNVIGSDGEMPWRLSTDLRRFKALTLGKPMIMGRKTFQAIGKVLPGRTTIVITRDINWQAEGCVVVQSLESAVSVGREIAHATGVAEMCIVGGGEIYRQSIDVADVIHLTRVHSKPEGDTVFPDIDLEAWVEKCREKVSAGDRDSAATTYIVYHRGV
jgi:dihydrofolate reductase